ncbi:FecR family protein [Nitrosospira multiformis]|uniref:FecR family protein n=1 Tax=Nitrosospira multiformis TaxID=1231 RepID=A0A2T5I6Y5_9PROT|nr:FecR domain-containing protein [Nitrosospira multiformis]PTQ79586.1 FecR family protein [Nitrosospira multiformis]
MPGSNNCDDADAKARHWFACQQSRALSAEERLALAEWLAASPHHYAAWGRVERDWQSLECFRGGLSGELAKARRQRPWYRNAVYFRRALAALVLAILPLLHYGWTGTTQSWQTTVGERRHIVLADSAQLDLDTATRITVTQSWFKRLIELQEGEIYLDVAPDWRPLVVMTADTRIRDVGTRFSVRNTAGKLIVQVAEGAVEVTHQEGNLLLRSGEMATRLAVNQWQLAKLQGEIANWRQGVLVFNRHPLPDVLQELARYHLVQFELTDSDLAKKQISGRFRLDELNTTLCIIAETLNLQVEHLAPARLRLSPAPTQRQAQPRPCR